MSQLRVLILGGTQFVGRACVERLLQRSDVHITLFNRQKTNPNLFDSLDRIRGNRETDDIENLRDKQWDVVIDFSGYYPLSLKRLIELLGSNIGRYIFISTLSVIPFDGAQMGAVNEDHEILACNEEEMTDTSMHSYGQRKAECERVLLNTLGLDVIILRPSIIYGRYDPTDRLYYWMHRLRSASSFILPENGADVVSFTYLDDLIELIVRALRVSTHRHVYNMTTHQPMMLRTFLEIMRGSVNGTAIALEKGSAWLQKHELQQGVDFPLSFGVSLNIDNTRMLEDFEMSCTPLDESFRETCQWYVQAGWPIPRTGLALDREPSLLGFSV